MSNWKQQPTSPLQNVLPQNAGYTRILQLSRSNASNCSTVLLIWRLRFFFAELCVMTPNISCRSLIQIGLQITKMEDKMAAVQGYSCISSVYISFQVLQDIAFRRMPASTLGFLVVFATRSLSYWKSSAEQNTSNLVILSIIK